jgi:hypothetical protein
MKVRDVVLNGVYDNYQRGRVSNILKTFNHMNMELDVDGRRVGPGNISNFRQETKICKTAELVTTFEVGNKISVKHTLMSLRHLPFYGDDAGADYGQKSRGNQPHLGNRGP